MKVVNKEYIITSDSFCDMGDAYCRENGTAFVSASYTLDGHEYHAGDQDAPNSKEFFAAMRAGASVATSQATVEDTVRFFEQFARSGKDILHIAFSSGLSGTYQSAVIAANEIMERYHECRVMVLDSLAVSMGEGMLLHYALLRKRALNLTMDELYLKLEQLRQSIGHYFLCEDLTYLHRGGRLSKLNTVLGTALGIKPLIYVDAMGKLVLGGKLRGKRQALVELVERMGKQFDKRHDLPVFIGHADCLDEAKDLRKMIQEKLGISKIEIRDIGPFVGTHSGPGTIGLFFTGRRTPVSDSK